ncbi:MAG TPA: hypothetical protein DCP92_04160 [Nitrospiraceae bacterium]|jgi:hypothetical protein|nr:hypothetical protein [Nitrospiraceae bacterium]
MITTAIVKKGGLYIPDLKDINNLKAKTVQVDITILKKPEIKTQKKEFRPENFRGLIRIPNLKKEVKRIRCEWDRL